MLVSMSDVSKVYPLGKRKVAALSGVNLEIDAGEFVVIKGQSGSGKSTLLNLLSALDHSDSGQVKIKGVAIAKLNESQRAKFRGEHIGIVFQSFNLIPVLTVLENVMYPLTLRGMNKPQAQSLSLSALMDVGLDEFAGQRPNQLSGGQMQRVAIARAIVSKPDLVLADEPTANLDSKTSSTVIELMHRLNQDHGVTFIIASHHDYVMQQASRLITLEDGMIQQDTLIKSAHSNYQQAPL